MHITIKIGSKSDTKEFLDWLTDNTLIRWENAENKKSNSECFFYEFAVEVFEAKYLIIENRLLTWENEDGYQNDKLIQCYEHFDDYDEAKLRINQEYSDDKINLNCKIIKAIDDKNGVILRDFLNEFTRCTWNNGDGLKEVREEVLNFELIEANEKYNYIIYIIEDSGKVFWETDKYEDEILEYYSNYDVYNSVRDLLIDIKRGINNEGV